MNERGLVEIFDGTEEVCFVFTEISLFYLRYLIVILDHLSMKKITTHLILIKGISPVSPNFYSKFYWNKKTLDAERFLISKKEYYNLKVRIVSKFDKGKTQKSEKQNNEVTVSCENAIRSYLSTHKLKTENIEPHLEKRRTKKIWRKQEKNYFDVFNFLENDSFLTQFKGKIIFLNGRYPDQSAIKTFCKIHNKSFLCLEVGMPPNKRMHLSKFQSSVVSELSQALSAQIEGGGSLTNDQIRFADNFLQINMTDRKTNHYLNLGISNLNTDNEVTEKLKVITIFSVSLGEAISNNGIESFGWTSQYEAIENCIRYLAERGYKVRIRMHPNGARNSWRDIKVLENLCKQYRVKMYLPWDEIDSYQLLKESEYVFTWGSTIGLEASAMGKKTYVYGRSYYSEIADIRVFSPLTFLEPNLENWTVNKNLAKQVIYARYNYGVNLASHTLSTGSTLILDELNNLQASYNPRLRKMMKKSYLFSAKNISNILKILKIPNRIINQILIFILRVYR
jgi:hypothetical protein